MGRWLLVLVVAGCNQVYGLDATRLPPDAAEFVVSGQLLHRWVELENGVPAIREVPLNQAFGVYLSRRTEAVLADIPIDADGRFTFIRGASDAPYRLELGVDGEVTELHGVHPEIRYVMRTVGRLEPTPIDAFHRVEFPETVMTAGHKAAVASTGIWAFAQQATGFNGSFYDLDWGFPTEHNPRHGLVDTTRGDGLYTLEYAATTSPEGRAYVTLARARANAATMMGASTQLPQPSPVTPVACSKLTGATSDEIARLDDALPAEYINRRTSWRVLAVPSLEHATTGGAELATEDKASADYNITPAIHNPIPDSRLVVVAATRFARPLRHPSSLVAATVDASVTHVTALACGQPTTIIRDPAIAIPGALQLGGTPLAADNVDIVAAGELELAWSLVKQGAAEAYTVHLFELSNIFQINTTQLRLVRTFQTLEPSVIVDPNAFVRGRYYSVAVTVHAGLSDAERHDFGGAPSSTAQVYSPVFRVR